VNTSYLFARAIVQECLERYILVKISRKTCVANKIADFRFWQLLQTYQFIVPKHLDIRFPIKPSLIEDCSQALTQMNFFKTPRNKLICLANASISIFNYLEEVKGSSASVDEFLQVLTYVVIKSNPASLISNITFIEDFRSQNLLLASWGYFLTNMGIAIDFINHLDPKYLTTGEEISQSPGNEWTLLTNNQHKPAKNTTAKQNSEPENKKVTKTRENCVPDVVVSIENKTFEERYKFWNVCPEDLKPEDLPELLQEYKRLALAEHDHLTKPRKVI